MMSAQWEIACEALLRLHPVPDEAPTASRFVEQARAAIARKRALEARAYAAKLRSLIGGVSPEALAVCRAWHGEGFGLPSCRCGEGTAHAAAYHFGGSDCSNPLFVQQWLERAEAAAAALRAWVRAGESQ